MQLGKGNMEIPWVIEEHTKVKHQLLKSYINPWMAILFSQQKRMGFPERLFYFDGFSGPGIYYEDNSESSTCLGSPLIVAEIANKYLDANSKREIILTCTDNHGGCVNMLNQKLTEMNKHEQRWKAYHAEFDTAINAILDLIEEDGLNTSPMFFFIDPFGYSGFPLSTIERILKFPQAELFINFMIYDIIRFCEEKQFEENMEALFGCKEFKKVSALNGEEKQSYLVNLYCKQLKNVARAEFVMPFRINTPKQGNRPKYYLIHASKKFKALKVMKDTMAKISDSPYSFVAIGISSQESLFENPDKVSLRERISKYCQDKYPDWIDYSEIEAWTYSNTNGISKTIKEALIALEKDNALNIKRKPRQRANTVTEGAKIVYIG